MLLAARELLVSCRWCAGGDGEMVVGCDGEMVVGCDGEMVVGWIVCWGWRRLNKAGQWSLT